MKGVKEIKEKLTKICTDLKGKIMPAATSGSEESKTKAPSIAFDFKALKNFDWRSLKKYTSTQASEDFNEFLEKLPQSTSQSMLIIAGVSWAVAGSMGLYTAVQVQKLAELRAELQEMEAVKPAVPVVRDVPVDSKQVKAFIEKIAKIYRGVTIKASGAVVTISAKSTSHFGQFREAVGHIQNGGSGWRVNIQNLCVGRECEKDPLSVSLKINKVSVEKPS